MNSGRPFKRTRGWLVIQPRAASTRAAGRPGLPALGQSSPFTPFYVKNMAKQSVIARAGVRGCRLAGDSEGHLTTAAMPGGWPKNPTTHKVAAHNSVDLELPLAALWLVNHTLSTTSRLLIRYGAAAKCLPCVCSAAHAEASCKRHGIRMQVACSSNLQGSYHAVCLLSGNTRMAQPTRVGKVPLMEALAHHEYLISILAR
jgi:hypothetical protein